MTRRVLATFCLLLCCSVSALSQDDWLRQQEWAPEAEQQTTPRIAQPYSQPSPQTQQAWQEPQAQQAQLPRQMQQAVVPVAFTETLSEPNSASPVEVSLKMIEAEKASLESAELTETQRPELEGRLAKAIENLKAIDEDRAKCAELENQIKAIPASIATIRARLSAQPKVAEVDLPADANVQQLESELVVLKQTVESLQVDVASKRKLSENRPKRLQDIAKEILTIQERVTSTQSQLTSSPPTEPDERSKWFETAARQNANLQHLKRLQAERRYLEAATELLPLQLDAAQRDLAEQTKLLAVFEPAVESWRKEESKRQADDAREVAEQSHPALRSLAEENAAIAEGRSATASSIERISKIVTRLGTLSTKLAEDSSDLRDKVKYAGTTSSTGILLRKQREELPSVEDFERRAALVEEELPRMHLQLVEWKKLKREVADPAEAANQIADQFAELQNQFGRNQVVEVTTRLYEDRRGLLDNAIADQDTYLQKLNELDLANQTLREEVLEFREFLDQHILWMRSGETLAGGDLRQAYGGLLEILSPARWKEVFHVLLGDLAKTPSIGFGAIALVVLLIVFREKMLVIQQRLGRAPLPGEPAVFSRYVKAFGITFLIAGRWPILLLAVGSRLKLAAASSDWTQAVGSGFLATVVLIWGCELIREVARKDGIGERLFSWPDEATRSIRGTLKATMIIGAPLLALLQVTQFSGLAELESLHRLLFISVILLLCLQIGFLLKPQGQLMNAIAKDSPDATIYRWRHWVWFGSSAVPGAFAFLSILGYHYSAYQLSGRLVETAAAIIGVIFVYAMALCWVRGVSYNKTLRIEQEAAAKALAEEVSVASSISSQDVLVQGEPQSDAILATEANDLEFRQLLKYATVAMFIFGGWLIWADVLPALHVLDKVELWDNIETVSESVTAAGGGAKLRTFEQKVPTTLTNLITAILVCVGTILIGRRLPGFLELTVLDRMPLDQGGRQAIAILIRYAATLAGLLFACHLIRLSWSSVQWLAAAMTVGLGFGLQEIFANLVSGIIILFERPIRMGDMVTVGDVTGNITKMQIRATTITDFDRRELIVPNKKFITDNVVNWTLSDPISRVVLPVGVAYGTDIREVEDVLMRIARQSRHVMQEPEPTTLFKGFGDSTLDMELRVFIPNRTIYIDVVNQINSAIAIEFEKAEIEIAFPQCDLHIKSTSVAEVAASVPFSNENTSEAA